MKNLEAFVSLMGLTETEAIKMIEKAMKDKAYRAEYNKRPERVEYRTERNRRVWQETKQAREIVKSLTPAQLAALMGTKEVEQTAYDVMATEG
jgi:hypothetical protein